MSFPANKTLIVTGASSGIGRALAVLLAREGANLVLGARRTERLAACAAECREHGVTAQYTSGSTAEASVSRTLVEQALELGEFHGFIHAAGVLRPGPNVWELNERGFDDVFDASVKGAWQLARAAYPHLLKQGEGLAVFFGSGAAERAQPGIGAYCAAKAAEEHLMRQLAAEAPQVATFAYRPHIVETQMQTQARSAEGGAAETLRAVFTPWKKEGLLITPEESAAGLMRLLPGARGLHGTVVRWSKE